MKYILLLLLMIFTACADDAATTGTSDNANFIKGKVLNTNGDEVSATVYLCDTDTTRLDSLHTDAEGSYQFEAAFGEYVIEVVSVGQRFFTCVTHNGDEGVVTIITSVVTDETNTESSGEMGTLFGTAHVISEPASGAMLYLLENGVVLDSQITDDSGEYAFTVSEAGDYHVVAVIDTVTDTIYVSNYSADVLYGSCDFYNYTTFTSKIIHFSESHDYTSENGKVHFSYDTKWNLTLFSAKNAFHVGTPDNGVGVVRYYGANLASAMSDAFFPDGDATIIDGTQYLYNTELDTADGSTMIHIGIQGDSSCVVVAQSSQSSHPDDIAARAAMITGITLIQ